MPDIADYTDEELGQMFRAASRSQGFFDREVHKALNAFCDWLGVVGLGWIAATIKTSLWAWDRVKSVWRGIFG